MPGDWLKAFSVPNALIPFANSTDLKKEKKQTARSLGELRRVSLYNAGANAVADIETIML